MGVRDGYGIWQRLGSRERATQLQRRVQKTVVGERRRLQQGGHMESANVRRWVRTTATGGLQRMSSAEGTGKVWMHEMAIDAQQRSCGTYCAMQLWLHVSETVMGGGLYPKVGHNPAVSV